MFLSSTLTLCAVYNKDKLQDFLGDTALIAAGSGGKDNVTATCIEYGPGWENGRLVVIRVARNAGMNRRDLQEMQSLCDSIAPGNFTFKWSLSVDVYAEEVEKGKPKRHVSALSLEL